MDFAAQKKQGSVEGILENSQLAMEFNLFCAHRGRG